MSVERLSTGIAGLDALLEGGIPKGFTVLIAGNPGTGKTVKPLGIPPSIRASRPAIPVESRSTVIMKLYKKNIK